LGIARSTLELIRVVIFSLFVLVGSGLIVDSAVLMLATAGLAVPLALSLLAGRWRQGAITVTTGLSASQNPPQRSRQRDGS
jgi:hypothetical protein